MGEERERETRESDKEEKTEARAEGREKKK